MTFPGVQQRVGLTNRSAGTVLSFVTAPLTAVAIAVCQ
jgi:hypothetical protein